MPPKKSNKTKSKKTKTGKGKGTKPVTRLSKPMKNAIQKIVRSDIETKYVTKYYGPSNFNGLISSKSEWLYPLPDVDQAATGSLSASNNDRIGDTIMPTSLRVYVTASIGSTVLRTVDILVKFFVFSLKNAKNQATVSSAASADAGNFLDAGSGNQAWTGETTDLGLPLNTKAFTNIKTYSFRLSKGCGYINGGSFSDTYVDGASRTFKHWVIDIPLPSNFKYNQNLDSQPQNFCPVMAVGYCHLDGTSADSVSQDITVTYRSNLFFKDA